MRFSPDDFETHRHSEDSYGAEEAPSCERCGVGEAGRKGLCVWCAERNRGHLNEEANQ